MFSFNLFKRVLGDNVGFLEIFGEPFTGKTIMSILYALEHISKGNRVLFFSTGVRLFEEKLTYLIKRYELVEESRNLIVSKLNSFHEQLTVVNYLEEVLSSIQPKLVIFDSFTELYRLALVKKRGITVNLMLNKQFARLKELSNSFNLEVLITNQAIHKPLNSAVSKEIWPLGGKMSLSWPDNIIKLVNLNNYKEAVLVKGLKEGSKVRYRIVKDGIKIVDSEDL